MLDGVLDRVLGGVLVNVLHEIRILAVDSQLTPFFWCCDDVKISIDVVSIEDVLDGVSDDVLVDVLKEDD